jgi:Zn-finger nucleic acid-binding protein
MNCPKCQTVMREREKGDLIIDVCPNCRGVFLDAGELEKLVSAEERVYERRGWQYDDDDDDDYGRGRGGYRDEPARAGSYDSRNQRPHKKKGFFSSIMESFGEGGVED